ncbi:hypothetical protein BMF94_5255 [Rhodotorula taiwanensis]|uniref:Major facilitator superfamily (MFS) profile domain-containing protein n=1 Tax=Rhodotorula taiwanensis TaxID=741276 RepID=A0A2S5B531_9BASI|nr:hypothetical protein BMF94_5255 [Rhodotorula taiwanensis]
MGFPSLKRAETGDTEITDTSSLDYEKATTRHREFAPVEDVIKEEDEDNVGQAQYIQSTKQAEMTPAENKAIVRRIDLFVLPLFLITQTLQYLDKTALNYAKVFGMDKAMKLTGNQFSWAASIFLREGGNEDRALPGLIQFGLLREPAAYLIGRYPAQKVLGLTCVLWGVCVISMIGCKNFATAMVNRFFLGFFEAAVTPGLSLMTGFYYTRSEAPLRQTIWYSSVGWGGMIGSLMAAGIERANAKSIAVPKWELIFIVLGAITVAWGAVLWFFLADGPSSAFWLSKEQRIHAVARVAASGVGIKSKTFKRAHVWEALMDPKAWCLTIAMFGSSVPNGILTNFSGTIIKDMGFSTFDAALLDCAGRSFQIISLLIAGVVTVYFKNTRMLMVTIGNVICVIATALLSFLPTANHWGRLISFWFINVQSVGFTLGLVMVSSNIATAPVTWLVLNSSKIDPNVSSASANEKPRYQSGAYAMMAGYVAKLAAHLVLWGIMYASNKSRDRKLGPADEKLAAAAGMEDKTESVKQNPNFRYVL